MNVFWDLDGVLCKYGREDYIPNILNKDGVPNYMVPGYFAKREANKQACLMLESMCMKSDVENVVPYILSRAPHRAPIEIQKTAVEDKYQWVHENAPYLPDENIIILSEAKVDAYIKIFGKKPRECDILIDDYNENIVQWIKAGGNGIKYINGINSVDSFKGAKITNGKIIDVPAELETMYAKIDFIISSTDS